MSTFPRAGFLLSMSGGLGNALAISSGKENSSSTRKKVKSRQSQAGQDSKGGKGNKRSAAGKGQNKGEALRPAQRLLRALLRGVLLLLLLALLVAVLPWVWVELRAAGRTSSDWQELPAVEVGVVLGTSPKLRSGEANPFFVARMDAAAELYHAGKVERLLVSGDNRDAYYNEVAAMRTALEERGVPADRIEGDAQGLRTLASIQRAGESFELERFVVVSQHFHAARAVAIARHEGLDALAYAAADVPSWEMRSSVLLREVGARLRMMLDLYLLNTQSGDAQGEGDS